MLPDLLQGTGWIRNFISTCEDLRGQLYPPVQLYEAHVQFANKVETTGGAAGDLGSAYTTYLSLLDLDSE